MSFDFAAQYQKDWRSLGFYYEFNTEKKCWIFTGSKNGLLNFCDLLNNYVVDPSKKNISEHEHYGPDSYLKVITWNHPVIKESGIYGTLQDIQRLSDILKNALQNANEKSELIIDREYSEKNEACILLKAMNDDFDPALFHQ